MSVRFVQTNPQPEPEVIPEYRASTRFAPTAYTSAIFREHPEPRRIPIASGRIEIRRGRQQATSSGGGLLLPRPGENEEGSTLRIVNLTPRDHTIRLTEEAGFGDFGHLLKPQLAQGALPKLFNDTSNALTLSGLGASVELLALDRMWVVVASQNAKLI